MKDVDHKYDGKIIDNGDGAKIDRVDENIIIDGDEMVEKTHSHIIALGPTVRIEASSAIVGITIKSSSLT